MERNHIKVCARTLRRALQELAEKGYVRRKQRYAHRWHQDWWYAPPEAQEAVPEAIAALPEAEQTPVSIERTLVSEQEDASVPIEETASSPEDLSPPLCSSNLQEGGKAAATADSSRPAARLDGGKGFGRKPQRLAQKLQEAVSRAIGKAKAPQGATKAPERRTGADGRIYTRIGNHWVVDDSRTAPIR